MTPNSNTMLLGWCSRAGRSEKSPGIWAFRPGRSGLGRGVQYASNAYRTLLANHHITPSMSRPANPYDNAIAESFMASFKTECFEHTPGPGPKPS